MNGLLFDVDESGATFSGDLRYRYLLWRTWNPALPPLGWIMLNPSTADAAVNDPTITRCCGFARAWGYGGITVANIHAYRATDPAELARVDDPTGPDNDDHLIDLICRSQLVVAAWGAHRGATEAFRAFLNRNQDVLAGADVACLGMTVGGHPRHPLYVNAAQEPEPWDAGLVTGRGDDPPVTAAGPSCPPC